MFHVILREKKWFVWFFLVNWHHSQLIPSNTVFQFLTYHLFSLTCSPLNYWKGSKAICYFSVVLGIYLYFKQLSQNKYYKILILEYHGKLSNVRVIQFITLICVDNTVRNGNEWWNERTKKIWFHSLEVFIFHVSTFLTTQSSSIKPKTQLLRNG